MSDASPPATKRSLRLPLLGALLHAGFAIGLLLMYVSYVPAAKRTFDEYGLSLPWTTVTVIKLSMWVSDKWWMLVPVFIVFGVLDFVAIWWFAEFGRFAQIAWVVGIVLVFGVVGTLTTVAIEMPMLKLRELRAQ